MPKPLQDIIMGAQEDAVSCGKMGRVSIEMKAIKMANIISIQDHVIHLIKNDGYCFLEKCDGNIPHLFGLTGEQIKCVKLYRR
jgi:hypothetical protein